MAASTVAASPVERLRRRWPAFAGIGLAGLTLVDLPGGAELAPILAASGLVYLGAAALQKQASAWPVFFGTFVLITVGKLADGPDPTWILLGVGGLFVIYGLLRGAAWPRRGLPLQTLAMIGFGGSAAIALTVNPVLGGYLVAAGLAGHAAWDVYHHRVNRVVARSLAEFCFVLDTLLAATIVIVTALG